MANPSKRKGSQWETDIVKGVRGLGHRAERIPNTGRLDESDVHIEIMDKHGNRRELIVEAKAEKTIRLSAYVQEAMVERDNYCKARGLDPADFEAVVFVKRRNHSWDKGYAVTTIKEYLKR